MTAWSIVSEGPSVVLALRAQHEGPIVAIKRAVCLNGRLPITYWGNWNRPLEDDEKTPPGPVVWTCPRLVHLWKAAGHTCDADTARNRGELEKWKGDHLDRKMYSLHLSVGRCIGAGATEINVYGADFDGMGNAFIGWNPTMDERQQSKWTRELTIWNVMVRECAANGVRVRRIGYEPE